MINRVVKLLLTPYVKYLRYIKSNTNFSLYETLYERSLIDSADYVERHLKWGSMKYALQLQVPCLSGNAP